jgi:hypothetical protein
MRSVLVRPAIAAALSAAFLLAASAQAALAPANGFVTSSLPEVESASTVVSVTDFDVTGIFSNEPLGDPLNEVFNVLLAPNASIIGIGWDVRLFADSPSWLSEMVVTFGSSSNYFVNLTPGFGDNFPGIRFYSSGGIVDLVGLGLDFDVNADGILRLEFWESFNDYFGDWDGIWQSGTLSIQWSVPGGPVIPEPGTWAMMIAGFGLVGFMARRRRETSAA